MKIKKIGLFGKFNDSSVADAITAVKEVLEKKGLSVLLGNTTSSEIEGDRIDDQTLAPNDQMDLAVVVGGDGTILHVARSLSNHDVPAVGVNLGRLGFLTDISFTDLEPSINAILDGNFHIENRTMLSCEVVREDKVIFCGNSLNDIVISKGNTGRLIEFEIWVNSKFVSQPRSDGLIIATPTGSTAYALSAGGPIIYPNLPVISLSPICPHTLSNRPIILDEKANIEIISVKTQKSLSNLALDGVMRCQIAGDEKIKIKSADKKLRMIRIKDFNYFETLRSKLGWQG